MLDGQIHDIGKVAETIKNIKEQLERKLKPLMLLYFSFPHMLFPQQAFQGNEYVLV